MQQAFICYVKFENISKVPVLIIANHIDEIKVPSIFCTLLYILCMIMFCVFPLDAVD